MNRWLGAVGCWVVMAVWANSAAAAPPQVPTGITRLMQDRAFDKAVIAIDEALKAKQGPPAYLHYLKGRALHYLEKYDAAAAELETVEKTAPDSPWARKARFARGIALARKGDFRRAEAVYQAEARYLLSADRKHEIAMIYREYADGYFAPADETVKPDFAKALEFYTKTLTIGPKPAARIEVELRIAQCQQELTKYNIAAQLYEKFIADHRDHVAVIGARFRLGESLLAGGRHAAARRTWRDLLELHPDAESDELPRAAFQIAATYHLPNPKNREQLSLGVAALRAYISRFPQHKQVPTAHLRIAQSYQNLGQYDDALRQLDVLLAIPRLDKSDEAAEAGYLRAHVLKMQGKFDAAEQAWTTFLSKHPTHKLWTRAQRDIIDTRYLRADRQYGDKKYAEARKLWTAFLEEYPLDARAASILFRFGEMRFADEKYDDAIRDWRRLVAKYPQSDQASRAQYMIGWTQEQKLGDYVEALATYRKVTWGKHIDEARAAIQRLVDKNLTIASERVFRSSETPRLKLTTRNIESVTVRVYSLDREAYFRKMHVADVIDSLDIALIDPDRTFEFKVPEYKKYRESAHEIEIPAGDQPADQAAGKVMAVTVNSETLEATALVLQSDLDVIVKSSREEVFVLAENLRTGRPWRQAHVLVSDGRRVLLEGVTGDDGVWREADKKLADARELRVLVHSGSHTASRSIVLNGLGVAQGLAAKGYIYTERPVYRRGQVVHVRGVLRGVEGDRYRTEPDKQFDVQVFNPANRTVHSAKVKLTKHGTFHLHFRLPENAGRGSYRILVSDQDSRRHQGTFQVHAFRLANVRLAIQPQRTSYYRGEEVAGKIQATYFDGTPLVREPVRYRLANGPLQDAVTDEQGNVEFQFPTREFRETQKLRLFAELPRHDVRGSRWVFLATRGFTLRSRVRRSVYLAGEPFEWTVDAEDAAGKPVARKLNLRIFRRTTIDGREGEVLHREMPVETDAKGTARQTLKLAEGGRYVLRVEGSDRFKNVVSTERTLTISDDQDRVRLRVLADRQTYRVGDVAKVNLHWRQQPALALVTFEGARILDYRLVRLKTGGNPIELPMIAGLAPNFRLSVCVMSDDAAGGDEPGARFHVATTDFRVQRQLNLAVSVRSVDDPAGPARPGQRVQVDITTTDPQGNAIAAEVAVALVERALTERFRSPVPAIEEFFRGRNRKLAMRTSASISFSNRPVTTPIDTLLLAEQQRDRIAAKEAERLKDIRQGGKLTFGDTGGFGGGGLGGGGLGGGGLGGGGLGGGGLGGGGLGGGLAGPAPDSMKGDDDPFGSPDDAKPGVEEPGTDRPPAANDPFGGDGNANGDGEEPAKFFGTFGKPARVSPPTPATPRSVPGGDIAALDTDGVWAYRNLNREADGDDQAALQLAGRLTKQGVRLLADLPLHETGYWNPAIVTDEQGKATLTFALPDRSTAWSLEAKGVTAQTLAGETRLDLVASKDLFGQLRLPAMLTDGDRPRIVASVHNRAVEKGRIDVELGITVGGKTVTQRRPLDVTRHGVFEVEFPMTATLPADARQLEAAARFQLKVSAAGDEDIVRRQVPIRPAGLPVFSIASGSAQGDVTAVVDHPPGMQLESPQLQLVIGANVERSLLDVVLAPPLPCQLSFQRLAAPNDRLTSDLMAALALQKLLAITPQSDAPDARALDEKVRSVLVVLANDQRKDGGWSWVGGGAGHRYATARTVWALSLAKAAGYPVADDAYDGAVSFLRGQLAKVRVTDFEAKAVLLHALATAGRGDFPLVNQLYRNRESLGPTALAYLALALVEMNRKPTALEILDLLAQREFSGAKMADLSYNESDVELRALYALALQLAGGDNQRLARQVDWLMEHRTGHRWAPGKAIGPAMLALGPWYAKTRFDNQRYKLTVFVNDLKAGTLEMTTGTKTMDVPADMLGEGKQRVRFEIEGRARFVYQCILGGFVSSDKMKSTTTAWTCTRRLEPAPLELAGRRVPRGFDVLEGRYTVFHNELKNLPLGKRGLVVLNVERDRRLPVISGDAAAYLVVTEPLPAGVTVVEETIGGEIERYELGAGEITFYLGPLVSSAAIGFEVQGYVPGHYQAPPTVARNAYRPSELAVAKAAPLTVLPAGGKSLDPYKLSPRERLEFGRHYFEKGDFKQARTHLTELFSDYTLQANTYREVVEMLLKLHLKDGPPNEIVRYFEIIIEKYPTLPIKFENYLRIGAAYHAIGEYERSYLVFRATVERSFQRESYVAGSLQEQGDFQRSVRFLSELLDQYPPEPYVAAAHYALAQRVFAKAPEAAQDAKLRAAEVTRVDLIRDSLARLQQFLTANPQDPAADQAAFALASGLLELDAYQEALDACRRYAERYPESEFLDSFWYIVGFCHFARGRHEQALEMCRKVSEMKRVDPRTGRRVEGRNKWRAVYIQGQIYHSLGQPEAAIREYRRVEDRFTDARQAIAYFARQDLQLPEVTTIQPGKPVAVKLSFRNVPDCVTTVYRIDLLKFTVLRRNLGSITNINLAGIRPLDRQEVKLGDGKDYRDRETSIPLPLKQEGAYLVVCRGAERYASGLVLISPIKVDVQEETASGRVRATVKDVTTNRYLSNVPVKVIGTGNSEFASGETDLRGVFVANRIRGKAMVIATVKGGKYAFYRGSQQLGPGNSFPAGSSGGGFAGGAFPGPGPQRKPPEEVADGKKALLDGLLKGNQDLQAKQLEELEELYKGVKGTGGGGMGGFGGGGFGGGGIF